MIKTISGNSNNALVEYAVRNSDAVKASVDAASTETDKSAILEKARQGAVYRLSDTTVSNSKNKDKRAVACTGTIFATVEGATAEKQVDFKVERAPDGKFFVSVSPFQFEPSKD